MALGDLLKQALEKHESESQEIERLRIENDRLRSMLFPYAEAEFQGIERLRIENDRLRSMLFPYADATQISGASWKGFYLIGNEASIKEFKQLQNDALQLEVYRKASDERIHRQNNRNDLLRKKNIKLRQKLCDIRKVLGVDDEG